MRQRLSTRALRRLSVPLAAFAFALVAAGCGGDGSNRMSGKVTFNGKPVPAGKIYFTPDGSKGNSGPAGYAEIKDGEYDTSTGKGSVKGAVIVAIEGIDPGQAGAKEKGDTSGEATVKSLFGRYETKLDVTGATTKDFEVPADAGKNQQKGENKVVQP